MRARSLIASVALLGLAFAGCGGDDDVSAENDDQNGTEATTGGATDTTESDGPGSASGEPIVLGMNNMEDAPAGSYPELRYSAEAAAQYINEELGGVDGRPIEIDTCKTDGSPEASQACANEWVEKGVPLVIHGTDFGTPGSVPVLTAAGIPYIGPIPGVPAELTSETAFFFTAGAAGAFPAVSAYVANELMAEKVVILHADNQNGQTAATNFGQNVLNRLGVTDVTLLSEKADAADFTAIVAAANDVDPDAIIVLFPSQGCSRIMAARAALGVSAPTLYSSTCADLKVLEAGGEGADGALFPTYYTLFNDDEDEQVALFLEKMDQYGPDDAVITTFSQGGFATVMNLYDVLVEIGADNITAESVTAAMRESVDRPNFMSQPYTCDGDQLPQLVAVCQAQIRMITYENGEFADVPNARWIDVAAEAYGR